MEQQAGVLKEVACSMYLRNSKEITVGHVELWRMNECALVGFFSPVLSVYNDDNMFSYFPEELHFYEFYSF